MPAASPYGGRGAQRAPLAEAAVDPEPLILESVLSELQGLRERSSRLLHQMARVAAHHPDAARQRFAGELAATHDCADETLKIAAERDGVSLPPLRPTLPSLTTAGLSDSGLVAYGLREARDLERQCTSIISQAEAVGLHHVVQALRRWRCELIGLEQPLIALNATVSTRRRR